MTNEEIFNRAEALLKIFVSAGMETTEIPTKEVASLVVSAGLGINEKSVWNTLLSMERKGWLERTGHLPTKGRGRKQTLWKLKRVPNRQEIENEMAKGSKKAKVKGSSGTGKSAKPRHNQEYNEEKELIRSSLDAILAKRNIRRYATLPGKGILSPNSLEARIQKRNPDAQGLGAEMDGDLYWELLESKYRPSGLNLVNMPLDKALNKCPWPLDFVFADFCGEATSQNLDTVALAISKMRIKGILAVTFTYNARVKGNYLGRLGVPYTAHEEDESPNLEHVGHSHYLNWLISRIVQTEEQVIHLREVYKWGPYTSLTTPMLVMAFELVAREPRHE